MTKVAQGFYARVNAYEAALESGDPARLTAALARNASSTGADQIADYVARSQARLAALDLDAMLGSAPLFAQPQDTPHV